MPGETHETQSMAIAMASIHGAPTLNCIKSTEASNMFKSRSTTRGLTSALCWIAVGFAGACVASPRYAWTDRAATPPAEVHAAATVTLADTNPNPVRDLMNRVPFEAGGPGLDDSTEWMPGNR